MDEHSASSQETTEIKLRRRSRIAPWLLGGVALLLLAILVLLQASGLWALLPTDTAADTLLLYALSSLNFIAFLVFALIFVRSLVKLRRERRARQLGAKIKTRLVVHFIAVSVLPITAMAVFSYLFFNRSIEKWFSHLPEEGLNGAIAAQHLAEENQARSLRETTAMLATLLNLQGATASQTGQRLAEIAHAGNLAAIQIVTSDGAVLAEHISPMSAAESAELRSVLERARDNGGVNRSDGRGFAAAVAPLSDDRSLVVVPARRSDSNLTDVIVGSRSEYGKLVAKQRKVRWLGLSTLGLMTLLLLFASTWIAIHLARGITIPIQALAEASHEVAAGNLGHRVLAIADDELAILVESFNKMTAQLAENRQRIEAGANELREKNLALEERHHYIETVLESLSTGVISVDESDRITTINAAAAGILGLSDIPSIGTSLASVTRAEDQAVLEPLLRRARRRGRVSEQRELRRGSAQDQQLLPVSLTATALQSASNGHGAGAVVVIEDLSELLSAQRAAAWSEVARRMAHEIKNPLTPIQLSAERIAKHFQRDGEGGNGHSSPASDAGTGADRERVRRVVEECTSTITREVSGLKAMVDEFSRFARLPHARLEHADLNEVVRHTVALYEDRLADSRMDVHLAHRIPSALLDAEQLRRALVNLIDNALEALAETEDDRRVTIATGHDPSRALLLIEVADTGHGIPRGDFSRLFQPYFSTRGRGTGLGLAIVQRIVSEHGGRIRAEAGHPRGAKFIIELPAATG